MKKHSAFSRARTKTFGCTRRPGRKQNRQLKLAYKFYHEAYKLNHGYYSGINAATLALLLGREDEAKPWRQKFVPFVSLN
jgi:hypothetical protein